MLDFLSDNAVFVVIVAVSIIIRLIGAGAKRRKDRSVEPVERGADREESGANFGHWEVEKKPGQSAVKKKPAAPRAARLLAPEPVAAALPEKPAFNEGIRIRPVRAAAAAGGGTFSEKMDRLSPLKKAVVFSEILSSPKGM